MPERFCWEIACYGQMTMFRDPGRGSGSSFGRWTTHLRLTHPEKAELQAAPHPWMVIDKYLPGLVFKYEDFDTDQIWAWVLTDQVQRLPVGMSLGVTPGCDLRLSVWPD